MENEYSFKELYDTKIKATYPIEIGNRTIEEGEIIAVFDKILVSGFEESHKQVTAHGGYNDRSYVFWDKTKDVKLSFTQGIFSHPQFALLTNSQLIERASGSVAITNREFLETNENGDFELKETPSGKVFVYEKESGNKIECTQIESKQYHYEFPYVEIIVDYEYYYMNESTMFRIGEKLTDGFVSLEGRTKIKEDITGQVKTGIIKIPKLKIMSTLSMRLGRNADPIVGGFNATAVPCGTRGQESHLEIYFLEDDIDSDM